jgi:peptide/nickel transport system ATP-binding protein
MTIVSADNVSLSYTGARWDLREVSVAIDEGTALGIVGESGSGKSSLVRILCGLQPLQHGAVDVSGVSLPQWLSRERRRQFRMKCQFVFQNPASSFDPRMRLRASLAEPVRSLARRKPSRDEMAAWLEEVGLVADMLDRYPHQLSGGQLQRVALARALSVKPDVLYADEPTSALDVSVQAQVLNQLVQLQRDHKLTLVLVSHDLAVVSQVCDTVVVMSEGRVEETGPTAQVMHQPQSDYTRQLVAAASAVSLS